MLKPATHVQGIKELYDDLKQGKVLNEMDWSLLAETILYIPPRTVPHYLEEKIEPHSVLKHQVAIAAMEYGDAILKQGASPDYEEKGFSPLDLLKLRVLEGVSQTESSIGELKQFAQIGGLKDETHAAEMMKLMRESILKNAIEPMSEMEKGLYAAVTIFDPAGRAKTKASIAHEWTTEDKPTPQCG